MGAFDVDFGDNSALELVIAEKRIANLSAPHPLLFLTARRHLHLQVWSGFYSSRPSLKQASRETYRALAAADTLLSLAWRLDTTNQLPLSNLTDAMTAARFNADIILHHDSITGTMCVASEGCTGNTQIGGDHEVLADYLNLLQQATAGAEDVAGQVLGALMAGHTGQNTPLLVNINDPSILRAVMRGKKVALVVTNADVQNSYGLLRIALPVSGVAFTDASNQPLTSQVRKKAETRRMVERVSGGVWEFWITVNTLEKAWSR